MRRLVPLFAAVICVSLLAAGPVTIAAADAPLTRSVAKRGHPHLRVEPGSAVAGGSLVRRPAYLTRGNAASLDATKARSAAAAGSGSAALPAGFAPATDSGFKALPNSSPVASPSDSTGSIGPTYVAAAVNVHFAIFTRAGSMLTNTNFRLRDMFRGLPNAIDTDPRVVYDPYADSFILAFLLYTNTRSWIVMASIPDATANRPKTWCGLLVPGDRIPNNGTQLADYTALGFSSDRITVATNQFSTNLRFAYVQVLSMRSSQFFDPSCKAVPHIVAFGGKQTKNPDGTQAFTLQPAVTYSAGNVAETTQYLASFERGRFQRSSHLILWSIRSVSGKLRLASTALKVGSTAVPPWGLQRGGTAGNPNTWWDTADLRLTTAFYDVEKKRLYTANAVKHSFGASPVSAIRWYEASPAATITNSTLTRSGYLGEDGSYAAWPSVATDQNGVLFVNFAQASITNKEYLSVYVDTVPTGTMTADPELLVKVGGARYEFAPGPERWGDYSAIARDPAVASSGLKMALFGAYATGSGGTTGRWQQWCEIVHQGP